MEHCCRHCRHSDEAYNRIAQYALDVTDFVGKVVGLANLQRGNLESYKLLDLSARDREKVYEMFYLQMQALIKTYKES